MKATKDGDINMKFSW